MNAPRELLTYRECYEAGLTQAQTAFARGVGQSAVSQWARKNGVAFRKPVYARCPEFTAELAELRAKRKEARRG